jgi:hypothetical protein
MHYLKRVLVNTIALPSLAVLGAYWLPAIASASPQPTHPPFLISKLLPKKTAYNCGSVGAITLTRDEVNRDRFTYKAVNPRGQTMTITNGVGYGDATSIIYTFVAKDGSEFIIEEFPTGKATLTTSGKGGVNSRSFSCTVAKGTRATSGESTTGSSSTSSESSNVSEPPTTVTRPASRITPQPTTEAIPALW